MSLSGMFSKQSLRIGLMKKPIFGYFGDGRARYSKIWEPDYLIFATTKTPEYDTVNVQIKGYDFVVLDKFQNIIVNIAKNLKINISKMWPAPHQDLIIHHYKIRTTEVQYEYSMRLNERNVQIIDVKSHIMPLFVEAVLTTCPPGVNISFHEHEEFMEEDRYIPNYDILDLQKQLDELDKNKKNPKKAHHG